LNPIVPAIGEKLPSPKFIEKKIVAAPAGYGTNLKFVPLGMMEEYHTTTDEEGALAKPAPRRQTRRPEKPRKPSKQRIVSPARAIDDLEMEVESPHETNPATTKQVGKTLKGGIASREESLTARGKRRLDESVEPSESPIFDDNRVDMGYSFNQDEAFTFDDPVQTEPPKSVVTKETAASDLESVMSPIPTSPYHSEGEALMMRPFQLEADLPDTGYVHRKFSMEGSEDLLSAVAVSPLVPKPSALEQELALLDRLGSSSEDDNVITM
jgi:hypothetical protein